jgi:hypothetical protein
MIYLTADLRDSTSYVPTYLLTQPTFENNLALRRIAQDHLKSNAAMLRISNISIQPMLFFMQVVQAFQLR